MEQNQPTSSVPQPTPQPAVLSPEEKKLRFRIGVVGFILFIIFVIGLFWLATTPEQTVGLTLSFVAGLSMIFLPCTLPLAFVIVPMTMGKSPKKGFIMALCFTLGLTITLSLYGVFIAAIGKSFGLKSDAEVYAVLFGGAAAFIFGLSEIGLLNFRLPSYAGNFPDFIQRQKDYVKTFLLGLLLGNAGVGCPNPAFYILLGYIATTGDLFNGWFLGFVHGLGRSVPLIFLAILGVLGVNALSGVAKHRDTVERAMGWVLVTMGAYLLTFGIFGHDWFIGSGIHSMWEHFVSQVGGQRFGEIVLKHEHALLNVSSMIQYGNMFFLGLLGLTYLTAYFKKNLSKTTIKSLAITYAVLVLLIGYSTGWTFKLATSQNVHMTMQGMTGSMAGMAHGPSAYHEESDIKTGLAINLNYSPIQVAADKPVKLDFFVNNKPDNRPILDLEYNHEKLMHVIGLRDDMNEFFHVHPTLTTPGHFELEYAFKQAGKYKLWSEVKQAGAVHTVGHKAITVSGETNYKKNVAFNTLTIPRGTSYAVTMNYAPPLGKNRDVEIAFDIHDAQGNEVKLEPYLGTDMHLAIIKEDWTEFIHAHPIAVNRTVYRFPIVNEALANGAGSHPATTGSALHGIVFSANFPSAGVYKAFAQFRPQGTALPPDEAIVGEFWFRVEETVPWKVPGGWWGHLIGSLILIALLSWGVNRYLSPKKT